MAILSIYTELESLLLPKNGNEIITLRCIENLSHIFAILAGVSNLRNGLWNGLMEWNIS